MNHAPTDTDTPTDGTSNPKNTERVPLSDAATAVLDVLGECSEELRAVRRRLAERQNPDGGGPERELTEEEARQTRDAARHVAGRLEACAGALQDASAPNER